MEEHVLDSLQQSLTAKEHNLLQSKNTTLQQELVALDVEFWRPR